MNTVSHYCLLSLLPGATASERVHIGLLHFNEHEGRFFVSERRLKGLSSFFDQATSTLIRNMLHDMRDRWNKGNAAERQMRGAEVWTVERLAYLNRYSNNLIHIGEVVQVSLPFNDLTFTKLIERFFDEQPDEVRQKRNTLRNQVKRVFAPYKDRLNLDYEFGLATSGLKSLTTNIKVSAAGRNECAFITQAINFNHSADTVGRHTAELQALFHSFLEVGGSQIFVIGHEPEKKTPQHQIWKRVHEVEFLEFVPFSEHERVTAYVKEHDVQFFEVIES